jgi:hypothetical protein
MTHLHDELDDELENHTDLHAFMDRALADLPMPSDRLQTGAVRRGRAVRRRRRAGAALGGLALAAAVTTIVLPSISGSAGTEGSVAHESGGLPSASADGPRAVESGMPSAAPDGTSAQTYEPPKGWWDMPGPVMRDRLRELLPDDVTISSADFGNDDRAPGEKPHGGWLLVDVVDGTGAPAGGINVLLYAPQDDGGAFVEERTTCPGNLTGADSCTELRDGDQVIGRTSRWHQGGVVVREVTLRGPDGAVLYIADSNSSDDKWGAGSSVDTAAPPLSIAQLRTVVDDPTWQDWKPQRG